MFNLFKNLFDENSKKINQYQKIVDQINELEPAYQQLSDDQLAGKTAEFKALIVHQTANISDPTALKNAEAQVLKEILPDAFATVRETARRVLGMRHFDVQLIAGMALHDGMITEQKTGEGKTLTVTAPLYLNALLGKGVHLVTVNDYLAEVGAGWMGPVFRFLGLSVSVIVHDQAKLFDPDFDSEERGDERLEHFKPISRPSAYQTDITYGTNNEFGFDYLRDNMVPAVNQMSQRPVNTHFFAIVDEADSILIDEARTPLIISAPDAEPTDAYYRYAQLVDSLVRDQDYQLDEKSKTATLTDLGVKRLEKKLKVNNLYEESFDTIHYLETALKAKSLYHRDKEYIVRDQQVIIVDEHTGRLMYGRRYSDGLHQAIEAKENVPIQQESRTLATISIQNYFRLYQKLAGMTGTAVTEAEEFKQIYDAEVLAVPTYQPVIRDDRPDVIYKTTAAKYSAIVKQVEEIHANGRPILIGTRSIEHNQIIAQLLKRKNIPHTVLNAKNHEKEAFIIADAGKQGAITVATNIAGRGVDIILGGAKPELMDYRIETDQPNLKHPASLVKKLALPPSIKANRYDLVKYDQALVDWQQAHDQVVAAGGLHVMGSERHESRRIDNQLRGRSGRLGDPGSTQFFVSLEDEIMRIFGGEQIAKVMNFLQIEDDQPIEHAMISKSIESAQVKVESFFFDQRKRLVQFDDVMNKQREVIYQRRRRVLQEGEMTAADQLSDSALATDRPLKTQIMGYLADEVASLAALYAPTPDSTDQSALVTEFNKIIPFAEQTQKQLAQQLQQAETSEALNDALLKIVNDVYQAREKMLGTANLAELERMVILSTLDEKWIDHLDQMEDLKDGIWLRGDKQTVLSEYKKESFAMFESLVANIESTVARRIFRVELTRQPLASQLLDQAQFQKEDIHESITKEVADATPPSAAATPVATKGNLNQLAQALRKSQTNNIVATTPNETANLGSSLKKKIGRNQPCPCGSGLKYKECGLINAPAHQQALAKLGVTTD